MSDPLAAAPEGSEEPEEPSPARRSTYLRSGLVALVVVAIIGVGINFFLLQRHSGSTVDGHEIAQRISQGIQFNTRATKPPQVACPPSLPASESDFDCTLEKGASRVVVEVHRRASTLTWTVTTRPAP